MNRNHHWTLAEDRAADRRAGIKEGSPRDNALDLKRGVPVRKENEVAGAKSSKSVGKGQAAAGPPPIARGTPQPAPPAKRLPLPPGVARPVMRRRMPIAAPPLAGRGTALGPMRPAVLPGVGGGGEHPHVEGGQRDKPGNVKPGVNAQGKKIGRGGGGAKKY